MSENRLIATIRNDRRLNKGWNKLTTDEKHFVLELANGDDKRLAELIAFARER